VGLKPLKIRANIPRRNGNARDQEARETYKSHILSVPEDGSGFPKIQEPRPAKASAGFALLGPENLYAGILADVQKQRAERIVNRSHARFERQRKFFTVDEIREWVRQGHRVCVKPRDE
jgi:hypothetical protein